MKLRLTIFILFLYTAWGCSSTSNNPFLTPFSSKSSPSPSTSLTPTPSIPDQGGIDPLNSDHISAQSHIYPFLFIAIVVLALCFGPLLWHYVGPWLKKKLDKLKNNK